MVTLREERKASATQDALLVVIVNGREVGFLTKGKNNATDTHPWKAFRGIGMAAEYRGSFYTREGGKKAALRAIVGS